MRYFMVSLWFPCFVAVFSASAGELSAPVTKMARYKFTEYHMGAVFGLQFYAPSEADANRAAKAAYHRIKELDERLSDYRSESELSQLSRSSGQGKPVAVGDDLWKMLSRGLELSEQSNGAFDVTAGPYIRLWRHARRLHRMPSEERLRRAKKAVGFDKMQLDAENRTVELTQNKMRLDLGGIAKGFAADEALRVLKLYGITSALVDAGGDLALGGPPPGKNGWMIGVAPLEANSPPHRMMSLAWCGVATSGDAFQHVVIDGTRYSHIIDPRTGLGIATPCNVTVIAPDATTADSLASAISVLGPQRGIQIADQWPNVAAIIVRCEEKSTRVYESKRVEKLRFCTISAEE